MALLATKLEMTRVVKDDKFVPVTLLQVPTLKVVALKNEEVDWYNAVVIGIAWKTESKLAKWKKSLNPRDFSDVKEFMIEETEAEKFKVGEDVTVDLLEGITEVSVESFSKWRWFSGAMKRHNFHGWPGGHGSKFHRALGSIGNRKPTRTHKGKKMHGHYGNVKKTLRSVPVEIVNKEMNVLGLRWPIPGARKSLVKISF